jgi:hypothetical protein
MVYINIFYAYLVYFAAVWYFLWPLHRYIFIIFVPILVCYTKKNLATRKMALSDRSGALTSVR